MNLLWLDTRCRLSTSRGNILGKIVPKLSTAWCSFHTPQFTTWNKGLCFLSQKWNQAWKDFGSTIKLFRSLLEKMAAKLDQMTSLEWHEMVDTQPPTTNPQLPHQSAHWHVEVHRGCSSTAQDSQPQRRHLERLEPYRPSSPSAPGRPWVGWKTSKNVAPKVVIMLWRAWWIYVFFVGNMWFIHWDGESMLKWW